MNKQSKLYQQRMVPIFRVVPGKGNWERLRDITNWQVIIMVQIKHYMCVFLTFVKVCDEGLILSFEYMIPTSHSHKVYFAFCYPFSYLDSQKKLSDLDQKYGLGKQTLYYHR